jgi:hypothetical protein
MSATSPDKISHPRCFSCPVLGQPIPQPNTVDSPKGAFLSYISMS